MYLLLADGRSASWAAPRLACSFTATAVLLALGSELYARRRGADAGQWLSSTYRFMLVRACCPHDALARRLTD